MSFFRNLFNRGRKGDETPEKPEVNGATPDVLAAPEGLGAPPVEAAAPEPAPVIAAAPEDCISIPLKAVTDLFAPEVKAILRKQPSEHVYIEIPRAILQPQLASGAMRISFSQLCAITPEVFLHAGSAPADAMIALPLETILKQMMPVKRADQVEHTLPPEIPTMFSKLGEPGPTVLPSAGPAPRIVADPWYTPRRPGAGNGEAAGPSVNGVNGEVNGNGVNGSNGVNGHAMESDASEIVDESGEDTVGEDAPVKPVVTEEVGAPVKAAPAAMHNFFKIAADPKPISEAVVEPVVEVPVVAAAEAEPVVVAEAVEKAAPAALHSFFRTVAPGADVAAEKGEAGSVAPKAVAKSAPVEVQGSEPKAASVPVHNFFKIATDPKPISEGVAAAGPVAAEADLVKEPVAEGVPQVSPEEAPVKAAPAALHSFFKIAAEPVAVPEPEPVASEAEVAVVNGAEAGVEASPGAFEVVEGEAADAEPEVATEAVGAAEGAAVPPDCCPVPVLAVLTALPTEVRSVLGDAAGSAIFHIPLEEMHGRMRAGKAVFKWWQLRDACSVALGDCGVADVDVSLPLPPLVPLYMAARNAPVDARKQYVVDASIPDVFSKPGGPVAAEIPFPVVNHAPVAAAVSAPVTAAPSPAGPVQAAAGVAVPFVNKAAPEAGAARPEAGAAAVNPAQAIQRIRRMEGITGAFIATADGLLVAGDAPDSNATALAAFAPTATMQLTKYSAMARLGVPQSMELHFAGLTLHIQKSGQLYLGVLVKRGVPVPVPELSEILAILQPHEC